MRTGLFIAAVAAVLGWLLLREQRAPAYARVPVCRR